MRIIDEFHRARNVNAVSTNFVLKLTEGTKTDRFNPTVEGDNVLDDRWLGKREERREKKKRNLKHDTDNRCSGFSTN